MNTLTKVISAGIAGTIAGLTVPHCSSDTHPIPASIQQANAEQAKVIGVIASELGAGNLKLGYTGTGYWNISALPEERARIEELLGESKDAIFWTGWGRDSRDIGIIPVEKLAWFREQKSQEVAH